jgi:hypothetical protein
MAEDVPSTIEMWTWFFEIDRREAQRAGRNGSEHRAGPEKIAAGADSP